MKTATINGKKLDLEYRTHSGARTPEWYSGKFYKKGLSCNVYDVVGSDDKVIVLETHTGAEIRESATLLSSEEYEKIANKHDPYNELVYHNALLKKCGVE